MSSPAATLPASYRFDAIGVAWTIETSKPLAAATRDRVLTRIEQFDATYSRFRPDSLVSRIAGHQQGGHFEFPSDSIQLFDLYDQLHGLTRGAVDPLVGRQLELLGYDAGYSLTPVPFDDLVAAQANAPRWGRDVRRSGALIETSRSVVIDVGAAGKGYLVDQVASLLAEARVQEYVVDASGDLRHHGRQAIRVGLEHPIFADRVIGAMELHNEALCASAVTRRAWRGLHHLVDPRTGSPTRDIIATWVVAHTAALADGLASALFFSDPRILAQTFDFAFVRMRRDHHVEASAHFDGELFVPSAYLHHVHHEKVTP